MSDGSAYLIIMKKLSNLVKDEGDENEIDYWGSFVRDANENLEKESH